MESPEGRTFPHSGCYLEVVPERRLVWTTALLPGFRPAPGRSTVPVFTAVIGMEPHDGGASYAARAMHGDRASCEAHEATGSGQGWGKALDQLVVAAKSR